MMNLQRCRYVCRFFSHLCPWDTVLWLSNEADCNEHQWFRLTPATLHLPPGCLRFVLRVIIYNNKNKVWNLRKASIAQQCLCVQSDLESVSFTYFTLFDGTNLKSYRRRHHETWHSSTSMWSRTGWTLQFVTCTRWWHRAPLIRYNTTTGPSTSHLHTDNWVTLYLTSLTNSWLNSSF